MLLRFLGIRMCTHCTLGPADLTDQNGNNLFFRKDDAISRITERLLARIDWPKVTEAFGVRYDAENLRMDLRRRVNSDLYIEFGRYLMLKRLSDLDQGEDPGVIVLEWSPFMRDILLELKDDRVRLIACPAFGHVRRGLREILAALKQTVRRGRDINGSPAVAGSIAVQYSLGFDSAERNDLAWLESSGVDRRRILLTIDGKATGQAARIAAEARDKGLRAVNMNDWQPSRSDRGYRAQLGQMWRAILWLAVNASALPLRVRLWILTGLLSFARGHARWSSFFNEYDVKLLVGVSDSDTLLVARTAAIEGRGGIDVSFQFSGMGWNLPANSRPLNQHLFFSWGLANAEMILRCDEKCPVKAPNVFFFGGHPYQYVAKGRQEEVRHEIAALRNAGCRLVILALDSGCGRDVPPTPRANTDFYNVVLEIVSRHPDLGLLIKPYSAAAMDASGQALFEKLKRSGQARQLSSDVRPFQIFNHADLVVGVGSGNSAVIEAASAEARHIFYDNYAWKEHIFYERLPRDLIVDNAPALERAILDHRDGTRTAQIQDPAYRDSLDWLDRFRDGKGHQRFGRLIALASEELDHHGDAMNAMPDVVARYSAEYGDNVVKVVRWPYERACSTGQLMHVN